jgi:quercetin dioxygenase-like cupin family protein
MTANNFEPQIAPVLEALDLDATVRFFADVLGFRIETVSPADSPVDIAMGGFGGRVVIRRSLRDVATPLIVECDDPALIAGSPFRAPNGTTVDFRGGTSEPIVPEGRPSLSIVRTTDDSKVGTGRAGMIYRDLLPDRWGGRFIASHIGIPVGGDVPDWVHYHRIRFQMIFCAAGWVEVVYEDQGPPFRLEAGDCVLQPPEIRHRVLRSSPGLEVIEVGCPAVHDTLADHDVELPTADVSPGHNSGRDPERDFGGQRFVRHSAADAPMQPWFQPGTVFRDTGIGRATGGLAGATVVAADGGTPPDRAMPLTHTGEFVFDVVLAGSAELHLADDSGAVVEQFRRMDAVAFPPGVEWHWSNMSDDCEFLEVALPSDAVGCARR